MHLLPSNGLSQNNFRARPTYIIISKVCMFAFLLLNHAKTTEHKILYTSRQRPRKLHTLDIFRAKKSKKDETTPNLHFYFELNNFKPKISSLKCKYYIKKSSVEQERNKSLPLFVCKSPAWYMFLQTIGFTLPSTSTMCSYIVETCRYYIKSNHLTSF